MAYLIDTDWTIDHLNKESAAIRLFESLNPEEKFVSILTYLEAYQGAIRDSDPSTSTAALHIFVTNAPILSLTIPVAQRSARIRQYFMDLGHRPTRRGFDILIAATAIEHDLTLVTRNVRDYADIPDLRLYEASAEP